MYIDNIIDKEAGIKYVSPSSSIGVTEIEYPLDLHDWTHLQGRDLAFAVLHTFKDHLNGVDVHMTRVSPMGSMFSPNGERLGYEQQYRAEHSTFGYSYFKLTFIPGDEPGTGKVIASTADTDYKATRLLGREISHWNRFETYRPTQVASLEQI